MVKCISLLKRFLIFIIITFFLNSTISAFEEKYLFIKYFQEETEYLIIKETAKINTKESKLISLEYIKESINGRNQNAEGIYSVLKFLAFEGTVIPINADSNVNDFYEVRLEAVKILGQFNNTETRKTFIEILQYENHPLILQTVVRNYFINWSDFYRNDDEVLIIVSAIEKIAKSSKQ